MLKIEPNYQDYELLERAQLEVPETYRTCVELIEPNRSDLWVKVPFCVLPQGFQKGLMAHGPLAALVKRIHEVQQAILETEQKISRLEVEIGERQSIVDTLSELAGGLAQELREDQLRLIDDAQWQVKNTGLDHDVYQDELKSLKSLLTRSRNRFAKNEVLPSIEDLTAKQGSLRKALATQRAKLENEVLDAWHRERLQREERLYQGRLHAVMAYLEELLAVRDGVC